MAPGRYSPRVVAKGRGRRGGAPTGTVQRVSHIPLYLQIEEELRAAIQAGNPGPLSRVESETELATRFRVSRMTARKALDRLVGDAVLFRRPGKGTFVATPKISHGPSQQLSFSVAMRALSLRLSTKVLEAGIVRAPANIASALNITAGSPTVFLRRLRVVEGEPVAIHTSYLPPRYGGVLEGDLTGSLTELMIGVGARVAESRDTVEAVAATGEEAELLKVPVGAPLVMIEGTAHSSSNEPLRHTIALYKGGRFRFTVDTSGPSEIKVEHKPRSAASS